MAERSLGICIGACNISFVQSEKLNGHPSLLSAETIPHQGNPGLILNEYFKKLDLAEFSVVVTGTKYKKLINTLSVSEPEAIEKTLEFLGLAGQYDMVTSLGGENFIAYCLDNQGNITNALTGNKCASGTGEFFLQQIGRMGIDLPAALRLGTERPHSLSGRCSVFCKSDCTHALNKGTPKGEVVAGLAKMTAAKIIELLSKQKSQRVLLIGGVSQNPSVMHFLREAYKQVRIPEHATHFEALGASLIGLEKETKLPPENIFHKVESEFCSLPPLASASARVSFKSLNQKAANPGDICILGLDVGSTTTKAVIMRRDDDAILASVYLRTNGDPVGAAIQCYQALKSQLKVEVLIIGLGVTGSGRQIAGLHALSEGVINEIVAHATAAAHFDKEVDTLFEIGGQDAKYTFLTNGVASDYAMNEACSAGTGSFLEESAKESLNIDYRAIGEMALKAKKPPNFNDQCSAFIQSDIKNSLLEGLSKDEIVAGLVYSICLNYLNRVKGNRPVGKKVFMQGGVCYNRAVPVAMAGLLNKDIIVPPEPGLMGAFGVALEIKKRMGLGRLKEKLFQLEELITRTFNFEKEFICPGSEEKCDRKCKISIINIEGKKYPFGGACNKYYNQRLHLSLRPEQNDYVKIRQELVFRKYVSAPAAHGKSIGMVKSFMTNTFYPLYHNFFARLGFRVILSEKVQAAGLDKVRSAFCFPVEISHGMFQDLLDKKPDYIFLPHIIEMDYPLEEWYKRPCVFTQAESYYLISAFKEKKLPKILNPAINFANGNKAILKAFVAIAQELGKSKAEARAAFKFAWTQQEEMLKEFKSWGKKALSELEKDKNKMGMVLFGRAYNAFVEEANLGIPHKFASKGIMIIPHDFLPSDHLPSYDRMYWYSGQQILRNARFTKEHPQLFGTFITNFSCGPDSFILSYFRKIMGNKPSLTLELDSHAADVGIDTRIEAALDIINNYLEKKPAEIHSAFIPLSLIFQKGKIKLIDAHNHTYTLQSKKVEVVLPSMGRFGSQALAAVFNSMGISAKSLPIPTTKTLSYGRSCTNCKECLPFILSTGSMLEYLKEGKKDRSKTLFFMPTGGGPCRQGQYSTRLKDIVAELEINDTAIFTLMDENAYGGLGIKFLIRAWMAVVISDLMQDMEHTLLALAVHKSSGLQKLEEEWNKLLSCFSKGSVFQIFAQLEKTAKSLSSIALQQPLAKAKTVSLVGEVYARREEFSQMDLIKKLSERGFVVRSAPVAEYIYYCNYLIYKNSKALRISWRDRIKTPVVNALQIMLEKKIKGILSKSGLVTAEPVAIEKTIQRAQHLLSEDLIGEGILTVGSALREIMHAACGVISIGPFACMPSRLAESILASEMFNLPFLSIETDGNPFPQIIQSKIEIFMLRAERFHHALQERNFIR